MKWNMSAQEIVVKLIYLEAPCHDLDDRIWRWVNEQRLNPAAPGWQYDLSSPPRYTESLDAARSLIPIEILDGQPRAFDYVLEHTNGGLTIGTRVGHADVDKTAFGANDAIALTHGAFLAHLTLAAEGAKSERLTSTPLA